MRAKVLFFIAALGIITLPLTGCGGGDGTSGPTAVAGVTRGVITSMGNGVSVNNVAFDTNNATITMDDPADPPVLKPGMVVTVKGEFNDATHGKSVEVKFADILKGPIATFDNLSSMVVLKQKVKFDPAKTVFDNFSGVGTSRVSPGQMVQISGFTDAAGTIQATFVERKLPDWQAATIVEIKGTIATMPTATTFTIGGLTADFTGLTLPTGTAVGSFVKVLGRIPTLTSTTLTATSVQLRKEGVEGEGAEGNRMEVEGFVSALAGNTFKVGGTPVNAGTLSLAGIANGVMVEVEGILVGGVLMATKIEVEAVTHARDFFAKADLVGTWNIVMFATGPEVRAGTQPGWTRGTATVDALGHLTFTSLATNTGNVTPLPTPGAVIWSIDANGVVSAGGVSGGLVGSHGIMAANKQMIVGTVTVAANSRAIGVAVKQVPGVPFTSADVIGPASFAMHMLHSGASTVWESGAGTINSSSQITITSDFSPAGPVTPAIPNSASISITSAGLVHLSSDPTFEGAMTPDKKVVIATSTDTSGTIPVYTLNIIMLTGQTFAMADLAGIWRYQTLSSSLWEYGKYSIASTGVATQLSKTDSNGNTTPGNTITVTVDPAGTIASPTEPTLHGTMSFNKQMIVTTVTRGVGAYDIAVALKR